MGLGGRRRQDYCSHNSEKVIPTIIAGIPFLKFLETPGEGETNGGVKGLVVVMGLRPVDWHTR